VIKAAATSATGEPILFLGLSGENVTRLTAGEPVRVTSAQMRELGLPPMVVVVHYGRTEDNILAEFREHGVTVREAGDPGDRH
jgi:hypothetical protein